MIRWMRAHNEQPGSAPTVSFFGFDMQFAHMAIETVLSYMQQVAPDRVVEVRALYQPFRQYEDDYLQQEYHHQPLTQKALVREQLHRVYELLSQQQAAYEAASSPQEFARTLQCARIVMQAERRYSDEEGALMRDQYMAENVVWLLQQAGEHAKIVLWAHNAHVATNLDEHDRSMGSYLRERYGEAMRVVGFTFYQGTFTAVELVGSSPDHISRGLIAHQAPFPPPDSFEHTFLETGIPRLFLDLRALEPGTIATDWLAGAHFTGWVGSMYHDAFFENFFHRERLVEEYDVLIYLQDTTASQCFGTPRKRPPWERGSGNLDDEAGTGGWFMGGEHAQDYEYGVERTLAYSGTACGYLKSAVASREAFAR